MDLRERRVVLKTTIKPYLISRDRDPIRDNRGMIEEIAKKVITDELPYEMKKIYDISFRAEIIEIREGSIEIFFVVIYEGYKIISNYKSFVESTNLIKKHCLNLLNGALKRDFGDNIFYSEVEVETPVETSIINEPNASDLYQLDRRNWCLYLVVINILLLVFIGILVYKAVSKVYFS